MVPNLVNGENFRFDYSTQHHISKTISISASRSGSNIKFQIFKSIPSTYTLFSTIQLFSNFFVHFFKNQLFTLAVTPILTFHNSNFIRSPKSNYTKLYKFSKVLPFFFLYTFPNFSISTLCPELNFHYKCQDFSSIPMHNTPWYQCSTFQYFLYTYGLNIPNCKSILKPIIELFFKFQNCSSIRLTNRSKNQHWHLCKISIFYMQPYRLRVGSVSHSLK